MCREELQEIPKSRCPELVMSCPRAVISDKGASTTLSNKGADYFNVYIDVGKKMNMVLGRLHNRNVKSEGVWILNLSALQRHSHCLRLPPTSLSLSLSLCPAAFSPIYQLQYCVRSHIRYTIPPTCHKPWQAKVVHVLDFLISDASLHLSCRDQSKVTRNLPLGDTPTCAAVVLLHDEGAALLLPLLLSSFLQSSAGPEK